jgi:hypothetical protein
MEQEKKLEIGFHEYKEFDECFYYRCKKSKVVNSMMWLDPLHQDNKKIYPPRLFTVYLSFDYRNKLYYEIINLLKIKNIKYFHHPNEYNEYNIEIDFKEELNKKIINTNI